MKRTASAVSGLVALAFVAGWYVGHSAAPVRRALPLPAGASIESCFSPGGGCTDLVVGALRDARQSVRVQAYSFTSAPIAQALVEAHRRGVSTEIILDKSQVSSPRDNRGERYSEADFTSRAGIPTFIDAEHAIAHNKVIMVDGKTVITGSFNFTKAAEERNAENLLIIRDQPELAKQYLENYENHREHSQPYAR